MADKTSSSVQWRRWALAVLTAFACGAALAQWQWVDATGRKVFSDTPPPASVPDKNILKRPGSRTPALSTAAPPSGTEAAATSTGAAPKLTGRDEQLEALKKQAELIDQGKKKAVEEHQTKTRAENCDRAKRAKTTLDSGIRIATTNARGEREIMDDTGRAAEAKRLDEVIRSECGSSVN
ncbi:MAG: DUF4124 domain-containing protein [Hydrogenophaga sp.]|uniref:DUF4124 domain-containing protein n=1 Tax=Hydrogenophaga sp. TaxID=1904254 RepID=UPI001BBC0F09|nr:DUF4124 domain-containing protein [Hydrogenophaga sp.]MBS3910436.1 DUF4124 domain-containing protein [Hydrogenophaga sp.]MDP2166143.1 DUF4124 domain-containing protein [Hydrogenophaga sp.]MDP3477819.1 DUF4124 domain-containing protein [Hydrogenophaga sp.]